MSKISESHKVYVLNTIENGSGPTVVFLHGMVGSARYWESITAILASTFHTISFDLLGFGDSPKPLDGEYDLDQHVKSVVSTLDSMNINQPIILVGHSMGALIALDLAARYPKRVKKLVLMGMPVFQNVVEARKQITRSNLVPKIMYFGASGRIVCAVMCKFRPLAQKLVPIYFKHLPKTIAEDSVKHTWYSYSRSMTNIIENQNVPADLNMLKIPVILLYGKEDLLSKEADIENLKSGCRDIYLRFLEGTHQLPIEQPQIMAEIIANDWVE